MITYNSLVTSLKIAIENFISITNTYDLTIFMTGPLYSKASQIVKDYFTVSTEEGLASFSGYPIEVVRCKDEMKFWIGIRGTLMQDNLLSEDKKQKTFLALKG